jgi:SAM-dependent methyltransferase
MLHLKKHPIIQLSYINQYKPLLKQFSVSRDTRVLDIGSGLGFMKPLVTSFGASYVGIEADYSSFKLACSLYGYEGFICGYFPGELNNNFYDLILVLSCIDEVDDKVGFLDGIKAKLDNDVGEAYIAVRNGDFMVNRLKFHWLMTKLSKRSQISANDLSRDQWKSLIEGSGLKIIETGNFWRPWVIEFSLVGIKNFIYKITSFILPVKYSYMLYYKVTK